MITTKSRSVTVSITYKTKDITKDIAPYLTAFTFTDNAGSSSDDISFSLMDREGLWLDSWFPSKGDKITCSILADDLTALSLPCGVYEVDQIDYSCPPKSITIKAVSTAVSKGMKSEKHSKAWENTGLKQIAADIANDHGLSLYFDADDVLIERREQITSSDLDFISALCDDFDLNVKVNEGKLIIYDDELNDSKQSSAEIQSDDTKLINWHFSTKAANIYKSANVSYHNAAKNQTFQAQETDDSVEGSERILNIHEYAENQAQAKTIARKKLLQANRREITGTITLMGDMRFRAGSNITLSGFGAFDGKYSITKAVHSVGNGYTTALELKQGTEAKKAAKKKKAKQQTPQMGYYTGDKYYSKE